MKALLMDGRDVLAEQEISGPEELEELNRRAREATDGNLGWWAMAVDKQGYKLEEVLKSGTTVYSSQTQAQAFYYKLWKCLGKAMDNPELSCHANHIVVHLGKSVESKFTYYDSSFDSWCDYFLK